MIRKGLGGGEARDCEQPDDGKNQASCDHEVLHEEYAGHTPVLAPD